MDLYPTKTFNAEKNEFFGFNGLSIGLPVFNDASVWQRVELYPEDVDNATQLATAVENELKRVTNTLSIN